MCGDGRIVLRTLVVLAALHGSAVAEPSNASSFVPPTRSTMLFVEGRELATSGRVEEACKRFEESWQLERAIGTALNLGNCREREGRLLEAWRIYEDAGRTADQAHDAVRAAFAHNRSAAVEARLTTLDISLAAPIAAGLSITINGHPVEARPLIRERLDPGPIEIRATTPDGSKHTRLVDPHPGNLRIVVPSLVRTRIERRHSRVVLAGSLLAAGALAAGVGVWFGNVADAERDNFEAWSAQNCPWDATGAPSCDGVAHEIAVHKLASVHALENVSTGMLVGSAVAAGTAAVVWWTAPRDRIVVTPVVTTSSVNLAVTARF